MGLMLAFAFTASPCAWKQVSALSLQTQGSLRPQEAVRSWLVCDQQLQIS